MKTPKLRQNGDGRAFATYPNSGGRRKYFGRYGTPESVAAYRLWLSDVMAALAAGEPPAADRVGRKSLTDLACDYLRWSETNHGAGERRNNRDTLALLLPFCGDTAGRDFGPNALRSFQAHLVASGRFSRTTVNSHVKRVKRFVRWCQSRELVPPGTVQELETVEPLRRGKTTARETAPVEPVPRAVWEATLPFLRKSVRAMVEIQFWTAMRPGEVCAMRPCDVERAGEVWFYKPGSHKTAHRGKTLIKAIPEPAQAILAPFLLGPAERPIFRTQKRRPFTTGVYGSAIRRGARRATAHGVPVPDWHPNQLRHAMLTEVRDTLGLDAAQWWAGHSEAATTQIYTWTAKAELTRIARAVGQRAAG